ncbi:MAG: ABC transporter permease [Anaerolineales bacterium]|nr:ABC transporter permease [Anaerolineales bacterium]
MERFWAIMRKELFHIWRDPRTLGLILALPAMLLVLLGFGISGEIRNTTLAIVDFSKTDPSTELVQKFVASGDFALSYDASNESELINLIDRDLVDVGILIPEDFGRMLTTGSQGNIQIFVDGSMNPTNAMMVQLKLSAISQMAAENILVERVMRSGSASGLQIPFETATKILYNPNGDQELYMIPGLVPILLQVQTLILSALAIVREREQGTMEQLIVTPIKPWELMLGKIIPYLFVSVINFFALIYLSDLLFDVKVAGSLGELASLSLIFIIGSLGMGVLISNISQSQMQAVYIAVFIVLIPAIILSGLLYSRENMPIVTYWYSELLPVTQYLEIARGIIVRGVSAGTLWWSSTFPLIVLSIIYFLASVFAFRKHL